MKHKIKNIHFIGIGGVGMSGIAEVLCNLGYAISGSDAGVSANTDRLSSIGVKIFIGHDKNNIQNADVVVTSTAIKADNPELSFARENNITIVPRAMMLAELMRFKHGIAIAGTHGKTTTTSLCAETMASCGLDPTFIIGGKLAVTGSNAKLGTSDYLVAEADESDASFLYLNPLIAVVTNIDLDHMDTYNHSEEELKKTFIDFLHKLPFYGKAILCYEDERLRSIISEVKRPVLTYGFDDKSDIYATGIKSMGGQMHYTFCKGDLKYPIILNLQGQHNVLNSLAVIAVALECGGTIEDAATGLASFHGVGRRAQHYPNSKINKKDVILVDDYGHHPTELKATISGLKEAYPKNRMILVFQPHRYTRTRDLFDDFVSILSEVDILVLLEVYAAGESPIPMSDGRSLASAIRIRGKNNVIFANDLEEATKIVYDLVEFDDLVVTMGAGNVSKLPQMLIEA
jgi:UDP-N-acetylmuramate--alanine ligase